jgi:superfamily II DNA or RNA helicase/DNA-binding XRE family transcriptional regulator
MYTLLMTAELGKTVREIRDQLGLSQAEFARRVSVSLVTVNRWERGHARPSGLAAQKIEELAAELERSRQPAIRTPVRPAGAFLADAEQVRLVVEAERLSLGHLANPTFGTETSIIDPLPHQRIAVYEHMLTQPRLRFLLADDAGAGKTIMAGLYIREMVARRLLRRILIIPPAGLIGNWERELRTLFGLRFQIVRGEEAREANAFTGPASNHLICSLDTLRQDRVFARLQDAVEPYDLVIFDEVHKLSADRDADLTVRKTDRYRLAEALAGVPTADPRWSLGWSAPHLLLLTATPHMGKDFPYYALWRLLEPEVLSTFDAFSVFPPDARMKRFIRRTKEEMVRLDGTPIYPSRKSDTLGFDLTQGRVSEQALYDRMTMYMQTFYNRAQVLNRSAARLAMSVFQRRLASSTYALLCSLERRLERLEQLLTDIREGRLTAPALRALAQRLAQRRFTDPLEDNTADEETSKDGQEEHEISERQLLHDVLLPSIGELEEERREVAELIDLARAVIATGQESKFEKLREVLAGPEFSDQKLIVFTEHRDTLQWLRQRLEGMGFTDKIAVIHGAMDFRERDAEVERFRRSHSQRGAQYLLATDAAGEGINLQFCWLMVNYDVPWNPARLEQRMGRIHRYGQKHDPVLIINLIANGTREDKVVGTLLRKLQAMRNELQSDKVFDVVGRLFQGVSITEFMAQALSEDGAASAESRIQGLLTREQIEAIRQRERRLYGDGGDVKRELPRLRAAIERETFKRLLPGYVRQLVERAADPLGFAIEGDLDGVFALQPLRSRGLEGLWSLLESYPPRLRRRLSVYRPADPNDAIFLHPGEPVFGRLRAALIDRFSSAATEGAAFVDPAAAEPYLLLIVETGAVRRVLHESAQFEPVDMRLVAVRVSPGGVVTPCPVEQLLLLRGSARFPAAFASLASRADEFEVLAREYADDNIAGALAEERRFDLLRALPEREQFLARGYDFQSAELAAARVRLTEKARQGDVAAEAQLQVVRQQQRSLDERRAAALTALREEPGRIEPAALRLVARALVVPSVAPEDRLRYDADVEAVAMRVARAHEEAAGAVVKDVSTPPLARAAGLSDHPGFDLLAIHPGGEQRGIEVKGHAARGDIEVTANEWSRACNLRDRYWLHVVFDCASSQPRLCRVQDPFAKLLASAKGSVLLNDREIFEVGDAWWEPAPGEQPLPGFLRPLFWDHSFDALKWPANRDLVISRVLQSGGTDAVAWLRTTAGDSALAQWIRSRSGRGLDPGQLRLWQTVLGLPDAEVDAWVQQEKQGMWETRSRP